MLYLYIFNVYVSNETNPRPTHSELILNPFEEMFLEARGTLVGQWSHWHFHLGAQ